MEPFVLKASGEREPFNSEKVYKACLRVGASPALAESITHQIEAILYDGIPTREIYHEVRRLLEASRVEVAARYSLKQALMHLGPAGFPFETYIEELLREHGYETRLRTIVEGFCVKHELDIIAMEKVGSESKMHMIECKYHNAPGIITGVKEVMYTYARFLDLREGWQHGKCGRFDQAWLVCNTKSSLDAQAFARCKGIQLLCWRYPEGEGLERLIDRKALYPVTVLPSLKSEYVGEFSRNKIMLVKDLARYDLKTLKALTGLGDETLMRVKDEAERLCGGRFFVSAEKRPTVS